MGCDYVSSFYMCTKTKFLEAFIQHQHQCFEQFGWHKTGEDIQITWDRDVSEDESASSDEELAGESGCESVTSPKCRESGDGGQTVMVLLILWHH